MCISRLITLLTEILNAFFTSAYLGAAPLLPQGSWQSYASKFAPKIEWYIIRLPLYFDVGNELRWLGEQNPSGSLSTRL